MAAGLRLVENSQRHAWSLQAGHAESLQALLSDITGQSGEPGTFAEGDGLCLLMAWPHRALLLTDTPALPAAATALADRLVDVSHGLIEFRLEGDDALELLASHC